MPQPHDDATIRDLEAKGRLIRRDIMQILFSRGGGHGGGDMSVADLVTALYFHQMRVDPSNPDWEQRDRLVLSKAHCSVALYASLGELGFFDKAKWFSEYGANDTILQGHADQWACPGVDYSGGSLGMGLGFAAGLALADLLLSPRDRYSDYLPSHRVYCITGDGESHEGSVWEAAMFAAQLKLSNLINIVDYNQYCIGGSINRTVELEPFAAKWRSFGWHVVEIDGHNMREICDALDYVDVLPGKPKCIVAHTVKGKGVPEWEDSHIHAGRVTQDLYDRAMTRLR
jgi:transketolase